MKKMKTLAFSNLIASIIFIIIGIWAWIQTGSFQEVKGTYVQASTFPRIMIVGMMIFSVILLIQSVYKLMTMKEGDWLAVPTGSLDFINDKGVRAGFAVILLSVLFVAAFKPLGYVVCGALISLVIMFIIGKRKWSQMVLVSVLVPLCMWFVFYKVLTVNIPMGPLTFLRNLVDKL